MDWAGCPGNDWSGERDVGWGRTKGGRAVDTQGRASLLGLLLLLAKIFSSSLSSFYHEGAPFAN